MTSLFSERRIVYVVIFLLAVGLVLSTFGLEFADLGGAFSPMFFPRIILFILLGLAVFNVGIDMLAVRVAQPIEVLPVSVIAVAFLAYVLLLVPLGYFLSSTGVGAIILFAVGLRNPLQVVLVPAAASGALVGLFNHVLKMPLPTSPFFWWI